MDYWCAGGGTMVSASPLPTDSEIGPLLGVVK